MLFLGGKDKFDTKDWVPGENILIVYTSITN
jgi:hypothetical protein